MDQVAELKNFIQEKRELSKKTHISQEYVLSLFSDIYSQMAKLCKNEREMLGKRALFPIDIHYSSEQTQPSNYKNARIKSTFNFNPLFLRTKAKRSFKKLFQYISILW